MRVFQYGTRLTRVFIAPKNVSQTCYHTLNCILASPGSEDGGLTSYIHIY